MRRSALLTGGAGFIGLHLARRLVSAGWAVVALDNLHPQVHADPEHSARTLSGTLIRGDVTDADSWFRLGPFDAIVHLAAETGVGQSMYAASRYRQVNVGGTKLAVDAARRWGAALVSLSSRAVYGEGRYSCRIHGTVFGPRCCAEARPEPSQEADPRHPVSVYGETKAQAEDLLLARGSDLPTTIVRPQNVIGPGQGLHNPYTGVLAAFLARLREGKPLQIYGTGNQTRDFIHVADLVELLHWLLDNPPEEQAVRVLNAGSGRRTSLLELARHAIAGAPVDDAGIEHVAVHRAGDIEHACADLGLATALGAPLPQRPAAQSVADFIQWAWDRPGARSEAWDQALTELSKRGLTS